MTIPAAQLDRDADGRFQVLASDEPFVGKIFSVRIDTVTMPGGQTARREIVDHVPAVAVVALDADGQVILIEQYRHPLRRRLWELPAGLMDVDGEDALNCAQRELREETGLSAQRWSVLVDLAASPGYCTEAIRVFLATGLTVVDQPPPSEEEADLRVVRVPLPVAIDAVMRGDIVNAIAVAGLLAAAREGGRHGLERPLRAGDADWDSSSARVNHSAEIGYAPRLTTSSAATRGS